MVACAGGATRNPETSNIVERYEASQSYSEASTGARWFVILPTGFLADYTLTHRSQFRYACRMHAIPGCLRIILVWSFLPLGCMTAASRPLNDVTFVAFDVETTGFNRDFDRIIEIGGVKFKGGKVVESRTWLINPGSKIPKQAQMVHGITDAMVADAQEFQLVFAEFSKFVGDAVLLAHNAGFDVRFMRAEIERNNLKPVTNAVLDTLKISRKAYPELESHSLESLKRELNLPSSGIHRALPDAVQVKNLILVRDHSGDLASLIDLAGMTISPAK